jgi:hypothetical protein
VIVEAERLFNQTLHYVNNEGILFKNQVWLGGDVLGCDFSESSWNNVIFYRVSFKDTKFISANLKNIRFVNCDMDSTNFMSATLENCTFESVSMLYTSMADASLHNITLLEVDSEYTFLGDANIKFVEGWDLQLGKDSKGNPIIYNKKEDYISHHLIFGTPRDCIKNLWENSFIKDGGYKDQLVQEITRLSQIKLGTDTLK